MSKSVDSGWVLTWKMVDDVNHVLARPVAGALRFPILGLGLGLVVQYGCACLRSIHLQVISKMVVYGALISNAGLVLMMHRSHLVGPCENIL